MKTVDICRRIALLMAILLSGGLILLPRAPMIIILIITGFAAINWKLDFFLRFKKIMLLLTVIFFIEIARPYPINFEALIIRYVNFSAAILIVAIYLETDFLIICKDLYSILKLMAIQAVLTTSLAFLAPSIFTVIPTTNEGHINTFLFVLNYHDLLDNEENFKRPDGFFWEPGVFQIYLNIYLFLALKIFRSIKNTILALISLGCVYSTTGVVITAFIIISSFHVLLNNKRFFKKIIIISLAAIIIPIVLYLGYHNIENKIIGESRGSSLIRKYDALVGLEIISQYPLFGIGFSHERYQSLSPDSFIAEELGLSNVPERTSSNGIIYLLYSIGIPLGLIFIFGIFKQKIMPNPILIGFLLILSMIGEALIFSPFILAFIFSAYVDKIKIK